MNINKIRSFCKFFRVILGLVLFGFGLVSGNYWFLLGAVPLFVGVFDICPLCIFSNKCDINEN
jgi:Protein of unknown function (DUF2892)